MKRIFEARASSILYNILRSYNDERPFLLPSNICPIVPLTFMKARRSFHFVDISERELLMDKSQCLEILRMSPKAFGGVLFVRTYGVEGDEDTFFADLKIAGHDLLVVDDKCLCRPEYKREGLTTMADVTLFSTGTAKYVDLDFGGFGYVKEEVAYIRQSDPYLEAALERVTTRYKAAYNSGCALDLDEQDTNFLDLRGPTLSPAAYFAKVRAILGPTDNHKRQINRIYQTRLPSEIQLPQRYQGWRFNIRVPESTRLIANLFDAGLFASRHYQSVTGVFSDSRFEKADRLHAEIVNLFNDKNYDELRAEQTAEIILRHLTIP